MFNTEEILAAGRDKEMREHAIAFVVYRDQYQRDERKRVRDEEKRLGGMITWIGASDEKIYESFLEHQKQNNQ